MNATFWGFQVVPNSHGKSFFRINVLRLVRCFIYYILQLITYAIGISSAIASVITLHIGINAFCVGQVYERSMKFSWQCSHVWRQFGLALVCGRQALRGVRVLQEVHTIQPSTSAVTCLLAAKVAFHTLNKVTVYTRLLTGLHFFCKSSINIK